MRFRSATQTRIGVEGVELEEDCGRIMINFSGWVENLINAKGPTENEKSGPMELDWQLIFAHEMPERKRK